MMWEDVAMRVMWMIWDWSWSWRLCLGQDGGRWRLVNKTAQTQAQAQEQAQAQPTNLSYYLTYLTLLTGSVHSSLPIHQRFISPVAQNVATDITCGFFAWLFRRAVNKKFLVYVWCGVVW